MIEISKFTESISEIPIALSIFPVAMMVVASIHPGHPMGVELPLPAADGLVMISLGIWL
jgi:hypothetical protein